MSDYRYGPVEFYLVGLQDERPDAATITALTDLVASGLVRLLDFVLVSKSEDGEVTVTEVEQDAEGFGIEVAALGAAGIAGEEDIAEFAELVPAGAAALLVVLELVYQRELASKVAASGAVLLGYDRVPAPVVNALMDSIEEGE